MPCGKSEKTIYHKKGLLSPDFHEEDLQSIREISGIQNNVSNSLYTSYLGKVNFTYDLVDGDKTAYLQTMHKVGNSLVGIKIIDYNENKIDINRNYTLRELVSMKTQTIGIHENKVDFVATLLVNRKIAHMERETLELNKIKKLLSENSTRKLEMDAKRLYPGLSQNISLKSLYKLRKIILSKNSSVDIMFNTINYLDFLYKSTGMTSVNGLRVLVSVCNVPNLDNAFFTGKYMVYGEGDTQFNPLVSIDVIGHELSHGLVSGTADLTYRGHSGALNESFADIMGTMFEFYMYDKYNNDKDDTNDIIGESDWNIGEDLGVNMPYLRSMSNPESARQPSRLNGKFYMDPTSQVDYGGVHINSGIPNYCFYSACRMTKNKSQTLSTFINCLKKLSSDADFNEFAKTLIECSTRTQKEDIYNSLKLVGLDRYVSPPKDEEEPPKDEEEPPKDEEEPPKDKEEPPKDKEEPPKDKDECKCTCVCTCVCKCCFCVKIRGL